MNLGDKMKLIAFDVDGTLLNTFDSIMHHVNESLHENGFYRIDDEEYVRRALGYGSFYLIEQALIFPYNHLFDKNVTSQVLDYYTNRYNSNPSELTKPYNGIMDLVHQLKEEGYILVAYSNKQDSVLQRVMADKFEPGLFDYIEGQKEGLPSKPNPQVLNSILQKFGLEDDKDQAIYVGDSDVDIKTAHNAGLKCLCVTWGFRDRDYLEKLSPDYLVDTTKEIKDIIDSLKD